MCDSIRRKPVSLFTAAIIGLTVVGGAVLMMAEQISHTHKPSDEGGATLHNAYGVGAVAIYDALRHPERNERC